MGTGEGLVVVYDLRTSTRWRELAGHSGPVSLLGFHTNGTLASYSSEDLTVRIWYMESRLLKSFIWSREAKKIFKLPESTYPVTRDPEFVWKEGTLIFFRESEEVYRINVCV